MNEHIVNQQETTLLRENIHGLLIDQIFEDPQIMGITLTPPTQDEWKIHMPTLVAPPPTKRKNYETFIYSTC